MNLQKTKFLLLHAVYGYFAKCLGGTPGSLCDGERRLDARLQGQVAASLDLTDLSIILMQTGSEFKFKS